MSTISEPLRRTTAIIELVALERDGMTIAKIADHLDLPAATAYRFVRKLVDVGFLEGEGRHAPYKVGPRLHRVANLISGGGSLAALADPILQRVADRLGVSTYLAGFFEHAVPLLSVRVPSNARSPFVHPGPQFEIHASASGKVLLAHQPESVIEATIAKGLIRLTERTITDPADLRAQLASVRSRGFAVSIGESDPSLWGIALPIEGSDATVNFAVGFITFNTSVGDTESYIETVRPVLGEAARQIGHLFKSFGGAP
jgi:IclR family transcriptional regulator, pca regulon regulatory protein